MSLAKSFFNDKSENILLIHKIIRNIILWSNVMHYNYHIDVKDNSIFQMSMLFLIIKVISKKNIKRGYI